MSDIKSSVGQIPGPIGSTNRGNDTRIDSDSPPPTHIDLERINDILMNYVTNRIMPVVDDNGEARTVPVLYGTPERWATVRKFGVLRDGQNDKLLTPMIMLRRTTVKLGQLVNPNNKYLYRSINSEWNARNTYDKFAVQNGIRPSQQVRHIMIPDYVDLSYEVVMWSEYQAQMDKLIEQINVENQEYWGERNDFKFRVSIEQFDGQNELPATADRVVRTQFTMRVSGYLLPERVVKNFKLANPNQETFTAKKVVAFTEVVSDLKNKG
jgi:hypothetical protein